MPSHLSVSDEDDILDVVGWGCGAIFLALRQMQGFPLKYVIHTDPTLWGSRVLDVEVRGPDALAEEDSGRVVVFAYSREFEISIREQVARIGPFRVFSFRDEAFYDQRYALLRDFFAKTAPELPPPPAAPLPPGRAPGAGMLRRCHDAASVRRALEDASIDTFEVIEDGDEMGRRVAALLADGALVGWHQGRRSRLILAAEGAATDRVATWRPLAPLQAAGDDDPLLAGLAGALPLVATAFAIPGQAPVETPDEAVKAFSWSELDYLVVGSHLIRKEYFWGDSNGDR